MIALTLAIACVALPVPASAATWHTDRYAASWSADALEVRSPEGALLLRWPVGAHAQPASPERPAHAAPGRATSEPELRYIAGVPTLVWSWRFAAPYPFREQREEYALLPDRIELRVRVRWREQPDRLLRIVYGGRLTEGCVDLEGLWEERRADGAWVPAPVPGVTSRTGTLDYRRAVQLHVPLPDALLAFGGIDEGDRALWDGAEVGQTPADPEHGSWTAPRRYRLAAEAGTHTVSVSVDNAAGNGGIWRGPALLGPRTSLKAGAWRRAEPRAERLRHWCPDTYRHGLEDRFTVSLTSLDRTREAVPENITTGGRFLMPPYVVAFESPRAALGIGTLDLPRSEDGLRLEWREGAFTCPFLLATEPSVRRGGWSDGPRLGLFVAPSAEAVLERYLAALPTRPAVERQEWWSGPEYCTWGDQCYASQAGGGDVGSLTEANAREWLSALDAAGIAAPLVVLDAGWWVLPRSLVDELHAEGRRVTLWTQPHWAPVGYWPAEQVVHEATGEPYAYDDGNGILDWTRPDVRARMASELRSYLTEEGWDADGIKLDFPYTPTPVWLALSDPSWGAGEQYRARVLAEVYRIAKAAKAEALVTLGCANPLFGRVQDVCRLNEDWFGDPAVFRGRAEVVRAVGEWANCDDWNAYEGYLADQVCERPVWGTFTLMSALWRGDGANVRQPLSGEWQARLRAITALAQLAPVREGQRLVRDPGSGLPWRVADDASPVAWALALDGDSRASVFAVAQPGAIHITSIAEGSLTVPVRGEVVAVTAQGRDGTAASVAFEPVEGGVRFAVADAASGPERYRVILRAP